MRGKDGPLMITFSWPKIFHYFELYFPTDPGGIGGGSTEPFFRGYRLVQASLLVLT